MQNDVLGYYEILGVNPNSGVDEIKFKYRDLAKFWHPDVNQDENAVEKFQLVSKAWEVLSDENERFNYDLLSRVYSKDTYPELENMIPFKSGEKDVRALNVHLVCANFIGFKCEKKFIVANYKDAVSEQMFAALKNWILGWWHPKAFIKNISALKQNWKFPLSENDSLRILVHNVVAYQRENKPEMAVASAVRALEYADTNLQNVLQQFIIKQQVRISRPSKWNLSGLRRVQLYVPMIVGLMVILSLIYNYNGFIYKNMNNINYYQEIDYGGKASGVNDLVLGKVLDIPVNKNDETKLYHLKNNAKIMYGPGDEFDVLVNADEGTTVRLTGVSPDRVWARIMIDNGEMGFVKTKVLAKGISKKIPYGSKIVD